MHLAFKAIGNGFPLIILHGLYGSGDNWFSIGRNLGDDYKVYLPDLRNHGHSDHSNDMNYNLMTSDIEEFFQYHNISEAFIIGHSMGGKVAMDFALKNPDKVKKLIIVDIALRAYLPEGDFAPQAHFHRKIIDMLLSIDIQRTNSRTEIDSFLGTFIPQTEIRQFLLKNLKRNNDGRFYWGLNLDALDRNILNILDAIEFDNKTFNKPVLLIIGKNSGYIKPEDLHDFKSAFPEFTHSQINSGHWVHIEQTGSFLKIVRKFLI